MRIFQDATEMIREVERDLWEMGIRVQPETMQDLVVEGDDSYETVELQGYGYMLTSLGFPELESMVRYLRGNLGWADAEFSDRISAYYINPGSTYKIMPVWEQFLRDGQFSYTYNERFREQLPLIVRELKLRPNTRQAILTMYDRHQDMNNWGGKDRVPCSLTYQFMIRRGKLNMIYTMRSCDFLTHFVHDVYLAARLLRYISKVLEIEIGTFTHFIGSLHAYKKDMKDREIF